VIELSPARESGLDEMPHAIERYLLLIDGHKSRYLGSRADEREVTQDDIPELGQFVDARLAEECPTFVTLMSLATPSDSL